jgi:hypothetical protein
VDSTHHERPHNVVCRFQRIVNPVIVASSEARDVLKQNPTASHFSHDPHGVEEQSGALAIDAAPLRVRRTGVLAGRASGDDFGKESEIAEKSICGQGSHVVIEQRAGIVAAEYSAAPRIDLAGGDRCEARAVKTEGLTTRCAAEQIQGSPSCLFPHIHARRKASGRGSRAGGNGRKQAETF